MSNLKFNKENITEKNVLIIGTSGNNNIMDSKVLSVVITDPYREILHKTKDSLLDKKYEVKVLNLKEPKESIGYNPFSYISDERSMESFIDCLICTTSSEEKDDFWLKSEKLLYAACITYLLEHCKEEDKKNLSGLLELAKDVYNKTAEGTMVADLLYSELPKESKAVKYYTAFLQSAGKTKKDIAISCESRISNYLGKVLDFMKQDDLHLEKIGEGKTALFIIPDPGDDASVTLTALIYTQVEDILRSEQKDSDDKIEIERIPMELIITQSKPSETAESKKVHEEVK